MSTEANVKQTSVIGEADSPSATFEHTVIGGYLLEERIGVGGYGEVWRAIGPGGLPKAVKLLFGHVNGPQAESEMRSLERMRSLRHPFLLNVERIDVYDGRMYVVTELADGSLEDRFQQAKKAGSRGLPREELLGYLRDTADALDFMAEENGLQHLDVKPENLLFQGAHIKVGDFGLTKDVTSASVSVMAGFTPLYTPPEVFEGRPCRASDQYSLAIVYQTMLTGLPPFSGRTPAQLAAQHLTAAPELQDLQPVDRPIVARALSKSPTARFPTCREFIAALSERRASSSAGTARVRRAERRTSETRLLNVASSDGVGPVHTLDSEPVVPDGKNAPDVSFRPTLFVGLGGVAGSILCSLHGRLERQFDTDEVSAFPLLYIDSDVTSIECAHQSSSEGLLNDDEVLLVPLKESREYRKSHQLDWLSRRWLFNIPRSGQVEGIRALGRLVFVDHVQSIRRRIRETIAKTMDHGALERSRELTGLPLESNALDVVIVASICGGIGSGAVLDMAYLVRDVLAEQGVESSRVSGCLLHATGASRPVGDLHEANSVCTLGELNFFNTAGLNYTSSWLRSEAVGGMAPFDDTYVMHLGDHLTQSAFGDSTRNVTDYLMSGTVSPARAWLHKWRNQAFSGQVNSDRPSLRTVGFAELDEELVKSAKQLCLGVVNLWASSQCTDEASDQSVLDAVRSVPAIQENLKLTVNDLSSYLSEVTQNMAETPIISYFEIVWTDVVARNPQQERGGTLLFQELADAVEADIQSQAAPFLAVRRALKKKIGDLAKVVHSDIQNHANIVLNAFYTVHGVAEHFSGLLDAIDSAAIFCQRLVKEEQHDIQLFFESSNAPEMNSSKSVCFRYFEHRIRLEICQLLSIELDELKSSTETYVATCISDRRDKLDGLRRCFSSTSDTEATGGRAPVRPVLPAQVKEHASSTQNDVFTITTAMIAEFEDCVRSANDRSIAGCMDTRGTGHAEAALTQHAVHFVINRLNSQATSPKGEIVARFPTNAAPVLRNVGGQRRILAVTPGSLPENWRQGLTDTFGDCVSSCSMADHLAVYCEVEGIQYDDVYEYFVRHNSRLAEFAERVHTRIDIDW